VIEKSQGRWKASRGRGREAQATGGFHRISKQSKGGKVKRVCQSEVASTIQNALTWGKNRGVGDFYAGGGDYVGASKKTGAWRVTVGEKPLLKRPGAAGTGGGVGELRQRRKGSFDSGRTNGKGDGGGMR